MSVFMTWSEIYCIDLAINLITCKTLFFWQICMTTDLHVLCCRMSVVLPNYTVRFFTVMDGALTTQIRKIKMVQCTKRSAEMCYTVHAYNNKFHYSVVFSYLIFWPALKIHQNLILSLLIHTTTVYPQIYM